MDKECETREAIAHLGEFLTPELREFAEATSRGFLWRSRLGKWHERTYTCSLCGDRFEAGDDEESDVYSPYPGQAELRHGNRIFCPNCEREVTVYDEWRSVRGCGMQRHFVEQWRVSRTDPDVIVAVGAEVRRLYRETGGTDDGAIRPTGFVVFKYGRAAKRYLPDGPGWRQAARLNWLDANVDAMRDALDERSVEEAIRNTVFRRMWFDGIIVTRMHDGGRNSPLMRLSKLARTPCAEYMIKLGFDGLIRDYMCRDWDAGPVNWKGKTMEEVFGLDRATVKALRPYYGKSMSYAELECFREMQKKGLGWPVGKLMDFIRQTCLRKSTVERVEARAKRYGLREAEEYRYFARQHAKRPTCDWNDLLDYRDQCDRLETPRDDHRTWYPGNLPEAHAEFTQRIKYQNDCKMDGMIQERLEEIDGRMGYTGSELFLRAARDTGEVIREGSCLHHCVAGYCARYAKGDTVILVLRRKDDPETPFHTVEMTPDGRLVQCRGDRNQTKEENRPAIERFWAEYAARKEKKRAC